MLSPPLLLFTRARGGVFGWGVALTKAFYCFGEHTECVLDLFEFRDYWWGIVNWGRGFALADEFCDDWVCDEGTEIGHNSCLPLCRDSGDDGIKHKIKGILRAHERVTRGNLGHGGCTS